MEAGRLTHNELEFHPVEKCNFRSFDARHNAPRNIHPIIVEFDLVCIKTIEKCKAEIPTVDLEVPLKFIHVAYQNHPFQWKVQKRPVSPARDIDKRLLKTVIIG